MLPEMKYIEGELLPMLRERAGRFEQNAQKQLRQWKGEKGVASLLLSVGGLKEQQMLPNYDNYEIHYDLEKMFVSQLKPALGIALANGDAVPSVRANVGCGAVCTLLGGLKQNFYTDKMPWLQERLTTEQVMEMTEESIEESPEFKMGLEQMRYMKEMLKGTGIKVFPMDLQGPIDIAHLLLGDDFFYLLYDEPEVVHKTLQLAVAIDTYAMKKCFEIIQPEDYVCHYNCLVLPASSPLKVSEDTSTLLSKDHLLEFMLPYTEQLLANFGGGYIHYCGDNQHLLKIAPTIKKSIGLNFGNPERHDPKSVLEDLGKAGMCYYGNFRGDPVETLKLARREDGRYNAFITYGCKVEDQAEVIDRFNSAIE